MATWEENGVCRSLGQPSRLALTAALPAEAQRRPYYADYSPTRRSIHSLCTSHYLDLFITFIICVNVITMSMEHYNQPKVGARGPFLPADQGGEGALPSPTSGWRGGPFFPHIRAVRGPWGWGTPSGAANSTYNPELALH